MSLRIEREREEGSRLALVRGGVGKGTAGGTLDSSATEAAAILFVVAEEAAVCFPLG